MESHIQKPTILYKYRNFEPRHLEILESGKVFFASPESFNDPFDCFIPVRHDLLSEEEFDEEQVQRLVNLSSNRLLGTHPEGARIPRNLSYASAKEYYLTNIKGKPDYRQYSDVVDMMNYQMDLLRGNVRVFCLSEESDNILLWSHYSSCHRGFCIGFDTALLSQHTGAGLGKVTYGDYPFLKPGPNLSSRQADIIQVLAKDSKWTYEKEWRYVNWDARERFTVAAQCIREVVVGCCAIESDIVLLREMIKSNPQLSHVRLFKATKVEHSFSISVAELK